MRVGNNPKRTQYADSQFSAFFLCAVTHLPSRDGYHAQRFEVVTECLKSMRDGAVLPHTFAVWDNGSDEGFRSWLTHEFRPDFLILSGNVGLTAAKTSLFRLAPPGSVIAYADDDMLFRPGWLEPQIALLSGFPNVACVSCYPVRTQQRWGNSNTLAWAKKNAKLEVGRFMLDSDERDFARSVGREPTWHADYTAHDLDYRITYRGISAYATAHHCQMVARAEVLARIVRYDAAAMAPERLFDDKLDELGLRLCTIERYARHVGNVLDDEIKAQMQSNRLESEQCPA